MFKTLKKLIQYPRLTYDYPKRVFSADCPTGKPVIDPEKCTRCGACASRCPSRAIVLDETSGNIGINLDECVFCALCEDICPTGAAVMTNQFELAQKDKNLLRFQPLVIPDQPMSDEAFESVCCQLHTKIQALFGRSLQIREIDSGSCNGCDYEINGLNNPVNDIERLGISFVASPRHADMLLVTGTAVRNMQLALEKTYFATPDPKLIVAVGACACSGGIFRDTYASGNGIDCIVPVDVYVPGCPPRPQSILYGILMALDKRN